MKNFLHKATLSALSVAALSPFCTGSADAALVAYYSFDSDFSDAEATTGGGTLTGGSGAITTTAGDVAVGSGAVRLGGGGMNLAETLTFGASDSWSVAFWGKRDSDADSREGMVLANGSSTFIWTPDNSSVVNGLRVRSSGGDTDYDNNSADYTVYNHWAIVVDGSGATKNIKIYLNGDEVLSETDTSYAIAFSKFGGWTGATSNNYDGVIDELYIYNEAISEATVQALVPEPGSLALLGLGGLCLLRRRRMAM